MPFLSAFTLHALTLMVLSALNGQYNLYCTLRHNYYYCCLFTSVREYRLHMATTHSVVCRIRPYGGLIPYAPTPSQYYSSLGMFSYRFVFFSLFSFDARLKRTLSKSLRRLHHCAYLIWKATQILIIWRNGKPQKTKLYTHIQFT